MMREIKFRGKNDLDGWVYGDYIRAASKYKKENIFHYIISNFFEQFEIHKESLGQYTGLKDKNGREIYEGDLYQYTSTSEIGIGGKVIKTSELTRIKPIVFEEGAFYHGHDLLADVIEYDDTFTYVGNIYENPELLEK